MDWYNKAKRDLSPDDLKTLRLFIQKIMQGKRDWTPEELQLQQNFSGMIEDILTKEMLKERRA